MTELIKYNAACLALSEAVAVDEVKNLRDKADAMRIYAMQAKNKQLEVDAAEIRIRAERRLGEMIALQKQSIGLNSGVRMAGAVEGANDGSTAVVTNDHRPKLSDVGISKDLSSRAQKLAAVPEEEFEVEIGEWRGRVTEEGKRVTTRLEIAGEKALNKKQPQPKQPEPQPEEELEEGLVNEADIAEIFDNQEKRIAELESIVASLTKEDTGKEIYDLKSRVRNEEEQKLNQMSLLNKKSNENDAMYRVIVQAAKFHGIDHTQSIFTLCKALLPCFKKVA